MEGLESEYWIAKLSLRWSFHKLNRICKWDLRNCEEFLLLRAWEYPYEHVEDVQNCFEMMERDTNSFYHEIMDFHDICFLNALIHLFIKNDAWETRKYLIFALENVNKHHGFSGINDTFESIRKVKQSVYLWHLSFIYFFMGNFTVGKRIFEKYERVSENLGIIAKKIHVCELFFSQMKELCETSRHKRPICGYGKCKKSKLAWKFRKCRGCGVFLYCSRKCQKRHWKLENHRKECFVLNELGSC